MTPVQPSSPSTPPEPFADEPARFLEWAARAVAHDLSNQLLAIQWCGSLLEPGGEAAEVRELVQEIDRAVARGRGSLGFLSLLIDRTPQRVEVRELLEHSSSLIRQALGSSVGVELDTDRCARSLLGGDPRGFVQALTMLAVRFVEVGPGGVLRIEASTRPFGDDEAGPSRLMVSLRCQTRAGAGPEDRPETVEPWPGAGSDAELARAAAYLERRLDGQVVWEISGLRSGCELRLAVAVEEMPAPACEETARGTGSSIA